MASNMVSLSVLLEGIAALRVAGSIDTGIGSLHMDSRDVRRGGMFFALRGTSSDGHDYIEAAVSKGAAAVLCERLPEKLHEGVAYVEVAESAEAAGFVSSAFYGHPSRMLRLVGVTGTNGKTTTVTLLYDMFRALGYEAGLISTVTYRVGAKSEEATHTTPDPVKLNALLAEMVDAGCEYCFMEVSSHSVVQKRIAGLRFEGGIFTNITHDHLDYHKTFAEYIKSKKEFFDCLPKEAFALVNTDDRNGRVMVQNTQAKVCTMALRSPADYRCRIIEVHMDGMLLEMDGRQAWVNFMGAFNAQNLLAVYAAARLLGAGQEEVLQAMSTLTPVRGRFENLKLRSGATAVIDYAHTPDALKNVVETINDLRGGRGRLITVVGCGGDRDPMKRPAMGQIAASASDIAIFTSDNPRSEDPKQIIDDMKAGLLPGQSAMAITDRREAIRAAVIMAQPDDVILVAGKGHETYQIVGSEKRHFDDREEVLGASGG